MTADPDDDQQTPRQNLGVAKRLENIEDLVETVRHVANKGLESWDRYLEQKAEGEEHARNLEDRQHRRISWVLVYSSALVVGLAVFALWKDQYDLVRLILSSSLALAAGAGITSFFRTSKKPPSK